ncbi:Ribosomal protein S6 modification protein [Rubripirellula amarantea]|uniref:Ribosomal protein S6 modification protein n=1 Tax=Rubripirellula amarantea TaxID=2527999 RepID=A0A5C5WF28_9BACT|nr:RimK family alpha-L-glutamate ligase [Rubripirellula amarantea]TWT49137.1 Ribosomal protein S6 modification protein [Rubripirellula amarantea]
MGFHENNSAGKSRFLMLGGGEGWHANQLRQACQVRGCELELATYQSLAGSVQGDGVTITCAHGDVRNFDAVLTRTMPAGSLEQITFRLATLHHLQKVNSRIINSPRSLEIAIDKFASLAVVASLGCRVPSTRVVQSRREAMDAYAELGGDCVVKPIFGGEGFGVMRVSDPELARTTFATLDQLGCVMYVQAFVPPGGADTRLLKIGDEVISLRRTNAGDFRTNRTHGGTAERVETQSWHRDLAFRVCNEIGLTIASVDLIDCQTDGYRVIEVNGIPGWQGAQSACDVSIAGLIIDTLLSTETLVAS